ncbi:alpha/beta fold hydrolase [Ferrovibrio sp.]|uniref:alpha/beta fold hydrolase n=1 Tax=Ferrovibrio sp. TaxID=1917215 RepID=UPI0025BF7462|nr:alpha/beta fold hydrolase [Ferrovibrio sp.]MBX3454233.1 alpha/beta fold hydrolase [Ferrovibrio sp.]
MPRPENPTNPPPQAKTRPGPRPLPLHLATANLILLSSLAAWPSVKLGWPLWKPGSGPHPDTADALRQNLASQPAEAFAKALAEEALNRLTALNTGIQAYRDTPYRRPADTAPAILSEGSARVLDLGRHYGSDGQPVLMVPSLVNRHYVLDLAPGQGANQGQSLAAYLARRGLHPLLVDWGEPGEAELDFDLTAYIERIARWLRRLKRDNGKPVLLLGYCMGGNLALAAALRAPQAVQALALLATPWDFHAGGAHQAALVKSLAPILAPAPAKPGEKPQPMAVDMLQSFFWALDPLTALKKFSQFSRLEPDSDAALRFTAMEDWLNDGIPLAGPVARECLLEWYGENTPAASKWLVAGKPVQPAEWRKPAMVVLPERDKLVPKAGAEALWRALPDARRHDAPSGHIGMVVGPRAEQGLWQPLADWLLETAKPA